MPKALGLNDSTCGSPLHEDSVSIVHHMIQSPISTQSNSVDDLPEPEVEKPKYGGDEIALMLAAEMHDLEAQVQDYREKAEKAEERALKWHKIMTECSQNHQEAGCQFAQNHWTAAQQEAKYNRVYMAEPEPQIAMIRDILAQFTDEDDLSETEMQPE
jgi:hypothetical protein